MPDFTATMIGIAVLAAATYLTRLTGYFLGGRVGEHSTVARVLEALPGAALAGVLALALSHASPVDLLAVILSVGLYLWTGRTLPALGAGLLLAVASAHLLPG